MVSYTLKEKVIKFLIENKGNYSILEISKRLKRDYKNTFQAIKNLSPKIISNKKERNSKLISFNYNYTPEVLSVEGKRREELLTHHPKLQLIHNIINELNYPFMIALLFGSFAKEENIPSSDLDLCIISDNKLKTKLLLEKLDVLTLKIEIHEFTSDEFTSMIEKKQNNLGNEIVKRNIIFFGIENYYNLISKWMKKE